MPSLNTAAWSHHPAGLQLPHTAALGRLRRRISAKDCFLSITRSGLAVSDEVGNCGDLPRVERLQTLTTSTVARFAVPSVETSLCETAWSEAGCSRGISACRRHVRRHGVTLVDCRSDFASRPAGAARPVLMVAPA